MRRLLAAALAGASALALVLAGVAWWTSNTALDTDRFVAVVGPVIDQPPVRAAITTTVSSQLTALVGVPALEPVIAGEVGTVVDGPQFRPVWLAALTLAHRDVVTALTGPQGAVTTVSGGKVSVDLIEVVAQVLSRLPAPATAVLGRGRSLHGTTGTSAAQVRAAVATYLGHPLPAGFALVPLMDASTLDHARTGVQALNGSVWVLGAAGILALAAALVVSRRRRRTVGQVALWGAAFTALAYLGLRQVSGLATDALPAGGVRPVVTAVVTALFDSLWVPALVLCIAGILVGIVGYLPRSR